MLDEDLADLFGVATKVINQAMKRNPERFPDDFALQVTQQEFTDLKSQTVTSSSGHGGRRKLPWAFTEHDVAMLSSVLRSPIAVQVNIEIMRAFIRMRRLLATPGDLIVQIQKLSETVQLHDDNILAITNMLKKMLEPPPEPPRGRVGFHPPEPPSTEPTKESS
jgi:hypothetical protein